MASWNSHDHQDFPGRQKTDGPLHPRTAKDCTYFDTALDKTYTCQYFQKAWGLSAAHFLDWNPSGKSDCSGIKVSNSYCVEVNNGLPRPTTTKKTTTAAPTKSSSAAATTKPATPLPSPTQAGLTTSCTAFYRAAQGDSCLDIVNVKCANKGFTLDNFYAWNPAVGTDCHGLLAGYYYCVGVVVSGGGKTTTTATTKKPTSTASSCTKKAAPRPTQPGTPRACKKRHPAKAGDTCEKPEKQYGAKEADILNWNPQVGGKARGTLWGGYNVCLGV